MAAIAQIRYDVPREKLFEMRAEAQVKNAEARELQARIRELENEIDRAADEHSATCAPIQAELADIERQQVSAILDRKPVDPDLETRRKQLARAIEDANAGLEAARDEAQRRIGLLKRELRELRAQTPISSVVESHLLESGDPEKVARHEGMRAVLQHLAGAVESVTTSAKKCDQQAGAARKRDDKDAEKLWQDRSHKWRHAIEIAQQIYNDLNAASRELRNEIVNTP